VTNVGSEFIAFAPASAAGARDQESEHNGSCEGDKPLLHSFQFLSQLRLVLGAFVLRQIGCGGLAQVCDSLAPLSCYSLN
jgi:hypothetical protein